MFAHPKSHKSSIVEQQVNMDIASSFGNVIHTSGTNIHRWYKIEIDELIKPRKGRYRSIYSFYILGEVHWDKAEFAFWIPKGRRRSSIKNSNSNRIHSSSSSSSTLTLIWSSWRKTPWADRDKPQPPHSSPNRRAIHNNKQEVENHKNKDRYVTTYWTTLIHPNKHNGRYTINDSIDRSRMGSFSSLGKRDSRSRRDRASCWSCLLTSAANFSVIALPIPEDPPVTSAHVALYLN